MTTSFKSLHALLIKTEESFETNLQKVERALQDSPLNSIVVAPEVAMSGFCYDRFEEAAMFSEIAKERLKELTSQKCFVTTLIEKEGEKYYNNLYCFFDKQIVHKQSKHKLFLLGDEQRYFSKGDDKQIKIIEIDGLRVGFLICFELRFIELWERLKGAEVIVVPAMWGEQRREHFITLCRGLALLLQCVVISCNSENKEYQGGSIIATPNGDIHTQNANTITASLEIKDIKIFRRYLDVGIR
ncbi:MAG: carbon-nitrogen hydrolase family protein [Campylobacterales bacterium]